MAEDPIDVGAVKVTVAVVDPVDVADTAVGEPGAVPPVLVTAIV